MLSYRSILKDSWKFSWKNKILWFFGFFASLFGFTAELKVISRSLNSEAGISSLNKAMIFNETGLFSKNSWQNILELFRTEPKSMIILTIFVLLILAISLFFLWLATTSQIAIVDAVKKKEKNIKEKIIIKKSLQKANKKFWSVLWLNILISLIIGIVYLAMSILLILVILKNKFIISLIYGLVFIIFIPLSLFLSFVFKYAITYVILENKKFSQSLREGWKLFFKNWVVSIEMAIILFFINLLAILALSAVLLLGVSLIIAIAYWSVLLFSSIAVFWAILILGVLAVVVLAVLAGALLNTFQISSWTKLFLQLRSGVSLSKIERVLGTEKK